MQSILSNSHCPSLHPCTLICVSPFCPASSPFLCAQNNCQSQPIHSRCKILRIQAMQSYLSQWQKWLDQGHKQYIARGKRVFVNIRQRIDREQCIFVQYCKEIFLGKEYINLMHKIEKKDMRDVRSKDLAAAISRITQPNINLKFPQFTVKQMQGLDQKITQLFSQIQQLYRNKYDKAQSIDKQIIFSQLIKSRNKSTQAKPLLTRSNSATLTRTTKQSLGVDELMGLKVDLSFPKAIDSKILKQASDLARLLARKVKKYHLAFRATQCNFRMEDFYNKVNHQLKVLSQKTSKQKLITLIIAKTQFGKTLGGWTSLPWKYQKNTLSLSSDQDQPNPESSRRIKYHSDPTATTGLFSLQLMQKYQLTNPHQAIYCGKKSIGFGRGDLRIVQSSSGQRKSYCKFPSSFNYLSRPYMKTSKSGLQLSGSRYSPFFKIQQWQCFIVQFS